MPASTRESSVGSDSSSAASNISRRELLAGAGAGAAALMLDPRGVTTQTPASRTVVFTNTTVVNVDVVQHDVALAIDGDTIAAIGPTDQILKTYPRAEVYTSTLQPPFAASLMASLMSSTE